MDDRLAPQSFGDRPAACCASRPTRNASPSHSNRLPKLRLADARGILQHGVEYRLKLAGRAGDDLEHVGGRGLLLQRFAQFVEQPRVLDGDDGLGGEVLDQLDLLVGERTNLLAVDGDRADQLVLLEHRHGENGPHAAEFDGSDDRTDRASM